MRDLLRAARQNEDFGNKFNDQVLLYRVVYPRINGTDRKADKRVTSKISGLLFQEVLSLMIAIIVECFVWWKLDHFPVAEKRTRRTTLLAFRCTPTSIPCVKCVLHHVDQRIIKTGYTAKAQHVFTATYSM